MVPGSIELMIEHERTAPEHRPGEYSRNFTKYKHNNSHCYLVLSDLIGMEKRKTWN